MLFHSPKLQSINDVYFRPSSSHIGSFEDSARKARIMKPLGLRYTLDNDCILFIHCARSGAHAIAGDNTSDGVK